MEFKPDNKMLFEAGTDDLGVQISTYKGAENLTLSNNDDWCGDTESGFGATVCVTLTRGDVEKLRDFLNEWLSVPVNR